MAWKHVFGIRGYLCRFHFLEGLQRFLARQNGLSIPLAITPTAGSSTILSNNIPGNRVLP